METVGVTKIIVMRMFKVQWVLLFSFLLTPVYSAGQNAKKFLKTGRNFVETQNFSDAIDQFNRAINLDPDFTKAYLARASVYEQMDSLGKAALDYRRASVFLHKNTDVHYKAGRLFNMTGKYDEALAMLNKATRIDKKNGNAFTEKAATYLALEDYDRSLRASDSALALKKSAINYYQHGLAANKLENYPQAEHDFSLAVSSSPRFLEPYLSRARLFVMQNKLENAMKDVNKVLENDDKNIEAYIIRSEIYISRLEYPSAINDISRILLIDPEYTEMYLIRGKYYQDFNQHTNAINDFSKVIVYNQDNPQAYFLRAKSYEEILDYKKASKDYETIGVLSKYDGRAMKLKDEAETRLFELNRETDDPQIMLLEPVLTENEEVNLPLGKNEVLIKGKIEEQSDITSLQINGADVQFERKEDYYVFLASVPVEGMDELEVVAVDAYENMGKKTFNIIRTEINRPSIQILAPYASDNGEVYLSDDDQIIYVEGKIFDESLITSIMIDGVSASYKPDEKNPGFNANINVLNKNRFTVEATDVFGNTTLQSFQLNREGIITQDNPMGKTWVVFIQNSNYNTFASLEGPGKDISLMKGALANYQINNIITKQDMTKQQLEKFFSIELRDLVRSNQVSSLLIWYAGHGKFVNDVGYWIPVDAERDDEFTYFNISQLKASLQSYSKVITHTLVVTDACESGPTFYQAMRGISDEKSCDDWRATRFKSSQVFSSAGYEEASDNSQFTRTFANALANNPNACIPIENIVSQVTIAVVKNKQQRPQFGKIDGLEDENGTFFFISK